MRESIGGSLLFNLVIIFTSIVILVFVSIMAYSKAYRVKNRIIEIVEKSGSYKDSSSYINEELARMGYETNSRKNCPAEQITYYENGIKREKSVGNLNTSSYDFCIYEVNDKSSDDSYYYRVVTYATFRFPVIGDFFKFKVKGETKILGKTYDY